MEERPSLPLYTHHGNDLTVSPTGSAALDPKGGPLTRLSDAGDHLNEGGRIGDEVNLLNEIMTQKPSR